MRKKMLFLVLAAAVLLVLLTLSAGAETVVPVRTAEELFSQAKTASGGTVIQLAAPEVSLVWNSQRPNVLLAKDVRIDLNGNRLVLSNVPLQTADPQIGPEKQGWLPLLKEIRVSGTYQPADVFIPKGVVLDVNGRRYQPTGVLTLASGAGIIDSQGGGSCSPARCGSTRAVRSILPGTR